MVKNPPNVKISATLCGILNSVNEELSDRGYEYLRRDLRIDTLQWGVRFVAGLHEREVDELYFNTLGSNGQCFLRRLRWA